MSGIKGTVDETKAKSAAEFKKGGLDKKLANFKVTGVVYFFEAESKTIINQVSVSRLTKNLLRR